MCLQKEICSDAVRDRKCRTGDERLPMMSTLQAIEGVGNCIDRQVTYVYVTHFCQENRAQWPVANEIQQLFAHVREFRRGVGIPKTAHPIFLVLWSLLSIQTSIVKVRLILNTIQKQDLEFLATAFSQRGDGSEMQFHTVSIANWEDPFQLTWVHKEIMRSDVDRAPTNAVFVYLEHDQMFSQENLKYVNSCHTYAEATSWSPDFLRIEWHCDRREWVFTDMVQNDVRRRPANEFVRVPYFQSPNQYAGMYVMSKAQAVRHFDLPSSNLERLRECIETRRMCELRGLRASELAALGARYDRFLSGADKWEGVSSSTSFIPIVEGEAVLPLGALTWHVSNNYARHRRFRRVPYGSVPVVALTIHE